MEHFILQICCIALPYLDFTSCRSISVIFKFSFKLPHGLTIPFGFLEIILVALTDYGVWVFCPGGQCYELVFAGDSRREVTR